MSSAINHSKRSHRSYSGHKNMAASFSASRPATKFHGIDYSKVGIGPLALMRGLIRKHIQRKGVKA